MLALIKLKSGEELLAILASHSDQGLTIEYPMEVNYFQTSEDDEPYAESTILSPWCRLSADRIFMIPKSEVLTLKNVSDRAKEVYTKLIESYATAEEAALDPSNDSEFELPLDTILAPGSSSVN